MTKERGYNLCYINTGYILFSPLILIGWYVRHAGFASIFLPEIKVHLHIVRSLLGPGFTEDLAALPYIRRLAAPIRAILMTVPHVPHGLYSPPDVSL